jgi:hypothetical protein
MKAISVKQPMAWAIFNGKDVENRNRATNYKGPLLIHSSMRFERKYYDWIIANKERLGCIPPHKHECIYSVFIGMVDLVDCVQAHESPWFNGRYGYILNNPREFREPVSYHPGNVGIYEVPDEVIENAEFK